jgi:hypothetical protein
MNKENPVAWFSTSPDGKLSNKFACKPTEGNWVEPLYTAPPKKEWVGLTDEEVSEIIDREIGFYGCWGPEEAFARAIEAKLREKNHG